VRKHLLGLTLAAALFLGAPLAWAITYSTFGTTTAYTSSNLTLSNGNLTGFQPATNANDQSAMSLDAKSTGLFYFEGKLTAGCTGANSDRGIGLSLTSFNPQSHPTGVAGQAILYASGHIYVNGTQVLASGITWTSASATYVLGLAVDLTHGYAWWTLDGTHWNSTSVANTPTFNNTGGGGVSLSTITGSYPLQPIYVFGCASGTAGDTWTANFGATAFSYTVPTGFTSGWPANVQPSASAGLTLVGVGP
jgi:hypothetical protein